MDLRMPHLRATKSVLLTRTARIAGRALVVVVIVLSRPAAASEGFAKACEGPRIAVRGELDARWRDALQSASERLLSRRDLDRCARVELSAKLDELEVCVKLADGRTTSRALRDPDALGPTLDALLIVPPTPAAPLPQPLTDFGVSIPALHPQPARPAHFEAGIGAMGRLAAAPLYAGVGLAGFAQLDLDRWLIGVTARWDVTDALVAVAPPSGFNMQTLGLGVLIGRRSSLSGWGAQLDTLVGPELLAENQEANGSSTQADGAGGGGSDFRLALAFRLSTKTSGFHVFAQTDLDLSPSRLRETKQLDALLPPLPSWSLGLVLGAAGRAP